MQRGTIVRRRAGWSLLYWDIQYRDGKKKKVRVSKKLANFGKEYPSKASVRMLADAILLPLNSKQLQPESSWFLHDFIEDRYFPAIKHSVRPSTYKGYYDGIWTSKKEGTIKLKQRLESKPIKLRDFRTVDGRRILSDITNVKHRTLLHIKSFLSGVFTFAKNEGVLDTDNPIRDVKMPTREREKKFKGVAYSIEDVDHMMEQLERAVGNEDGTASELIALLSFTGLRQSEARGLRWSDWDELNQTLMIQRSAWGKHIGPTKNPVSENTIPVLPLLRDLLTRRRDRIKPDSCDYIFAGSTGKPLNFHNLETRVIKPAVEKPGIDGKVSLRWAGFHGFRRGLATNLIALDVKPAIVSAILRHSDVAMTLEYYAQTNVKDTRDAMTRYESRINAMNTGLVWDQNEVAETDKESDSNVSPDGIHEK